MLSSMKIGKRLGVGFGVVVAMTVMIGLVAAYQVWDMHHDMSQIQQRVLPGLEDAAVITENVNIAARAVRNAAMNNSAEERSQELDRIFTKASPAITRSMERLQVLMSTPEEKETLAKLKDARAVYLGELKPLVAAINKGDERQVKGMLFGSFRKAQTGYLQALDDLNSLQKKTAAAAVAESNHTYKMALFMVSAVLLLAVAATAAIALALTRSIVHPINRAVAASNQVADGVTSMQLDTTMQDECGDLMRAMERMVAAIQGLVSDSKAISLAAIEGRLSERVDVSRHTGEYRTVVEGVNATINRLVGLLDAMPAPAMIIDADFTVRYINQIGAQVGGKSPEQVTGSKCYDHFKTSDCNTGKCACGRAVREAAAATSETDAHPGGLDLEISYTGVPLRHTDGTIIGAFEIVTDQTAIKAAARKAARIAEYQNAETAKVVAGLNRLAQGDTSFSLTTDAGDVDTEQVKATFETIAGSVNSCVQAIGALVCDADMLSRAAVAGKLATRADATRHQGDYRKIVEGVNSTLDAVIGPLNVAAEYVARISKGEIPPSIMDTYQGDFNEIKNNLNLLISALETITGVAQEIALGNLEIAVVPRSDQDQLMLALKQMVAHLQKLAASAGQIASGDLTVEASPASEKDLMGNAFVTMIRNLREIVGNVSNSAESIATASQQIATGNANMAQRTEEQAASLEETASSMEEMTSTVKQNADNAQQANQLAIDASEVAVKGGDVINRVVTTMDAITASSKKISDIIGVIDGIAFQTNILALNAAVEAARAGEQGRGFAVVAGEVRNLAQRSAAAAKEIKSLISDSVDRVCDGSKLVGEAGQTMQEIVVSIKRVTDIMSEISAASVEQSDGIEQVNTAITQMDEITQQNASVVQEAASAASALEEQAQHLLEAVAQFKLETHAAARHSQQHLIASPQIEKLAGGTQGVKKANGYHKPKPSNGYHDAGHGTSKTVVAKAVGHDEWHEF